MKNLTDEPMDELTNQVMAELEEAIPDSFRRMRDVSSRFAAVVMLSSALE